MSAPTLAVGTATYTRHDAHTRRLLDGFRTRLTTATPIQLVAAAYRAETLPGHGMADDLRTIVEHEVEWRRVTVDGFADWYTTTVVGGAK